MARSKFVRITFWVVTVVCLGVACIAFWFWLNWGRRDYEPPRAELLQSAAASARQGNRLPSKEVVLAALLPGTPDADVNAFLHKLTETHELIWMDWSELKSGEEGFSLQEPGERVVFKSEDGKIARVEVRTVTPEPESEPADNPASVDP